MTGEEFVALIHKYVDSSAEQNLSIYKDRGVSLTGSVPAFQQFQLRRGDWIRSLSDEDHEFVLSIVKAATQTGLYWLITLLDGIASIDSSGGKLELYYCGSNGERILLNDPKEEPLNEVARDRKYWVQ